jgi:hypothetical protein
MGVHPLDEEARLLGADMEVCGFVLWAARWNALLASSLFCRHTHALAGQH